MGSIVVLLQAMGSMTAWAQSPGPVAIVVDQWECDEDVEFAQTAAEHFVSELSQISAVRVLSPGHADTSSTVSIDFRVRGRLESTETGQQDILSIELMEQVSNQSVFHKTFIREPGLEVPLANATTAARSIVAFITSDLSDLEKPEVVSRDEWDAIPPKEGIVNMCYSDTKDVFLNWIVVHHTGYNPSGPREVQDEHVLPQGYGPGQHPLGRNWFDVGYHFMVDSAGTVYAGRDLEYIGSHVGAITSSLRHSPESQLRGHRHRPFRSFRL